MAGNVETVEHIVGDVPGDVERLSVVFEPDFGVEVLATLHFEELGGPGAEVV